MLSNNEAVSSREIQSIQKMDELSLYLEISKSKMMLKTLKLDALTSIVNEVEYKKKKTQIESRLSVYFSALSRFGIDPENPEMIATWLECYKSFLNNLDVVEYTKLLQLRATCQNLSFFELPEEERAKLNAVDNKFKKVVGYENSGKALSKKIGKRLSKQLAKNL